MAQLTDLIAELTTATEQMESAARGGDWDLVALLQKRRRVLIESLVEQRGQGPLTEIDAERLAALRRQEALVAGLAKARLETLRRALTAAPDQAQPHHLSRMERAYREGGG